MKTTHLKLIFHQSTSFPILPIISIKSTFWEFLVNEIVNSYKERFIFSSQFGGLSLWKANVMTGVCKRERKNHLPNHGGGAISREEGPAAVERGSYTPHQSHVLLTSHYSQSPNNRILSISPCLVVSCSLCLIIPHSLSTYYTPWILSTTSYN